MPLRCKICGQFMKDGFFHVMRGSVTKTSGLMTPKDKTHAVAVEKFSKIMYRGPCPICGGIVNHHIQASPDGDASWEIICSACDFPWDED